MSSSNTDRLLWLALTCLVLAALLDSCSGLLPTLKTADRQQANARGTAILNSESRMGDRGFSPNLRPGLHTVWCRLAQRHKTESWRFSFVESEKGPEFRAF